MIIRSFLKYTVFIFLLTGLFPVCQAQLTKEKLDSGWVSLFNGKDLSGFYAALGGEVYQDPKAKGIFWVDDNDNIATSGKITGHLATKEKYSHYRFHAEIKFDKTHAQFKFDEKGNDIESLNAGLLYHIREDAPKLNGIFPRSIEFQGDKKGLGEVWTISDVWVTTTKAPTPVRSNWRYKDTAPIYKEGGVVVQHGDPQGRHMMGSSNPYTDGKWNTMELYVRGGDSTVHIANGEIVFKAWNLRVADDDSPMDFSDPLSEGHIGLQSEGAPVRYQNIYIQELHPDTGLPIHGKWGCTDPKATNHDAEAKFNNGTCIYD